MESAGLVQLRLLEAGSRTGNEEELVPVSLEPLTITNFDTETLSAHENNAPNETKLLRNNGPVTANHKTNPKFGSAISKTNVSLELFFASVQEGTKGDNGSTKLLTNNNHATAENEKTNDTISSPREPLSTTSKDKKSPRKQETRKEGYRGIFCCFSSAPSV